jgi:hypothetical protein
VALHFIFDKSRVDRSIFLAVNFMKSDSRSHLTNGGIANFLYLPQKATYKQNIKEMLKIYNGKYLSKSTRRYWTNEDI